MNSFSSQHLQEYVINYVLSIICHRQPSIDLPLSPNTEKLLKIFEISGWFLEVFIFFCWAPGGIGLEEKDKKAYKEKKAY